MASKMDDRVVFDDYLWLIAFEMDNRVVIDDLGCIDD